MPRQLSTRGIIILQSNFLDSGNGLATKFTGIKSRCLQSLSMKFNILRQSVLLGWMQAALLGLQ